MATNRVHSVRACAECGTMVGTCFGATVNLSAEYASGYYSRGDHAGTCATVASARQAEWAARDARETNRKIGARYRAMILASVELSFDEKMARLDRAMMRFM